MQQQKIGNMSPTVTPLAQISVEPNVTSSAVLGTQSKNSACVATNGLPDHECTPGAIFPQATISQICTKGYTKTVRNVPLSVKRQVYAEYGIVTHAPGDYEVDHLISLELGGSNDIANLWPEAAAPTPGFHEKDMVENYLHDQVCSGKMSLSDAQEKIATNWLAVYTNVSNIQQYNYSTPQQSTESQ